MEQPPKSKGKIGLSFAIGKDSAETPAPQAKPPLRLLVVGDFGAQTPGTTPQAINKDNFNPVLASHGISLFLEVPNHLAPGSTPLRAQYSISDMLHFNPATIIANIPELTSLYLFRERLQLFIQGEMPTAEFLAGLDTYGHLPALDQALRLCRQGVTGGHSTGKTEAATKKPDRSQPSPQQNHDDIDRILDMVAQPQDTEEQHNPPELLDAVNKVIDNIGRSNSRKAVPAEITQALAFSEHLLSRQLDEILHHPQFQAVEASWRGLKFLVDGIDFNENITLEFLHIAPDNFAQDFHQQVFLAEYRGESPIAPSVIGVNLALGNSGTDMALLEALGKDAEALQVPLLISVAKAFFGSQHDALNANYLGTLLRSSAYDKWNSIRDKDYARWLCLLYNRFLLRPGYDPENSKGLGITEAITQVRDHLMGNPLWLALRLVARSFAETGWPTEIHGLRSGNIDDLDLYTLERAGQEPVAIPLEDLLPESLAYDLMEQGITPLLCQANRDSVLLAQTPMLQRPRRYNDPKAGATEQIRTTLAYQLFAARVAEAIAKHKSSQLVGDMKEAQERLEEYLSGLLAGTGSGAQVDIQLAPDPDHPGHQQVSIQLRAGSNVVNGAEMGLNFML